MFSFNPGYNFEALGNILDFEAQLLMDLDYLNHGMLIMFAISVTCLLFIQI